MEVSLKIYVIGQSLIMKRHYKSFAMEIFTEQEAIHW